MQRLHHQGQMASEHQASLVNQLNQIGVGCAARARCNHRPAGEIFGYDANGFQADGD